MSFGMNNKDILKIAMQQSAFELGCTPEDFLKSEHLVTDACLRDKSRVYYEEPHSGILVSYGSNIVASVKPEYRDIVAEYVNKFEFSHCFETPNLYWLDDKLKEHGKKICFMAEYFLPDIEKLENLSCEYEIRVLEQKDLQELYKPEWSNAILECRKELDMLGVGAYDQGRLIGLAGCSADCEDMWQIGVDVLPEYRKKGVAAALVSHIAMEILERGKIPFYCAAWSNLRSVKTAIRCGFVPAWVEMSIKPIEFVDEVNR